MPDSSDSDDLDHDREGPDPEEMDSSDEADLEVCPNCRKLISEETERCPHCGEFITLDNALLPKPMWIVIGIVVALLIALLLWGL